MDYASFNRSENIKQLCFDKGVKMVYLPPYSPDLTRLKSSLWSLKPTFGVIGGVMRIIRSKDVNFIDWCVDKVETRGQSARGHFQSASLDIEDLERKLQNGMHRLVSGVILHYVLSVIEYAHRLRLAGWLECATYVDHSLWPLAEVNYKTRLMRVRISV